MFELRWARMGSSMGLRSVAEQSEEQRGGPGSILSRQRDDHAELYRLMLAYDEAPHADERASARSGLARSSASRASS